MDKIELVTLTPDNISEYGFCGFKKPSKTEGYQKKHEWIKKQFLNGMRFKVIQSEIDGTIASIEYIPGEYSWRAVNAKGYMVIHCLMSYVKKHQKKGYGALLINDCMEDALKNKMNGVAVVTSGDSFMADKEIFHKNGFVSVDSAPPKYNLLVKKINIDADDPKFYGDWDKKSTKYSKGLTIIYSDQCPMISKWVYEIFESSKELGITTHMIKLDDYKQAQQIPSPYGTFAILQDGKLLYDRPISGGSFAYAMSKILKKK